MQKSLGAVMLLWLLAMGMATTAESPSNATANAAQSDLITAVAKEEQIDREIAGDMGADAHFDYRDPLHRDTPRGALQGFFHAADAEDFNLAAKYLDLRYLPRGMNIQQAPEYAMMLLAIIDRNLWVDLARISDSPEGAVNDGQTAERDSFASLTVAGREVELLLQRVPGSKSSWVWKVSSATVAQLPELYRTLGYSPLVEWYIRHVPAGRLLMLDLWEWALILSLLGGAFIVVLPLTWLLRAWLLRSRWPLRYELARLSSGALRFLLAVLLYKLALGNTTLPAPTRDIADNGLLLALTSVWMLWSLTGLVQSHWRERLMARGNKQAAALLRPLSNLVRTTVLALATLMWLQHMGFNAGAILAGMGIGGIAVALASKQSIENFIGAVTLYASAPVKVGQRCKMGELEGRVEEIGLRLTRIRTLDRSVLHIPNAKLAEMEIENLSEREKIRFNPAIRLDYATGGEQIQAIVTDIKALLARHPMVEKQPLEVTLGGFGQFGLELKVLAYLATTSVATYHQLAHELHLGIMTIIEHHGSSLVPAAMVMGADEKGSGREWPNPKVVQAE
ncbi:mechanosensitive ion channel family protein [Shewanella sedimentimangrovi]|nr:mechanosensitive ion channel family protein [Shewanella sedimentimangrovi]